MTALVMSAHLDDAVLSANARLQQGDVLVLTVFAGLPPAGFVAEWDEITGAADSRQRVLMRYGEDDEALQRLGIRSTIRLPELDEQYRDGVEPSATRIAERVEPHVSADITELWIPAAIGHHRDHMATREAGLLVARAHPELQIWMYADAPYSMEYGWPPWITGVPGDPHLDVSRWLDVEMRLCGLDPSSLEPKVIVLSETESQLKRYSVAAYVTQLPALKLHRDNGDARMVMYGYELVWSRL